MSNATESLPSNRKFGLVLGSIFVVLGYLRPSLFEISTTAGFLMICIGLFIPRLLTIPNKVWMKIGQIMHGISNPMVMFIFYFIIICPIGFVLRFFKNSTFQTNLDSSLPTYWSRKDDHGYMKNQF